jgi:ergothioneine biosynthesis protein EgtB
VFGLVCPNALQERPIALRQPFIFYLGHLPAFAWNQVGRRVLGRAAFRPELDALFERGIDPPDTEVVDDAGAAWPEAPAVEEYRERVRRELRPALGEPEVEAALWMVLEHELMHQETLLYMMQRLPIEQKVRPGWVPPLVLGRGRPAGKIAIPAGPATLGARFDELAFGWDNEFSAIEVPVPAFRIDGTPVTNVQYLAFVEDGGYRRPDLWGDEDLVWRGHAAIEHPMVWELVDGRWTYRTLFERVPLDAVADWPVYVSLAEARAFARWRGERLPTEAEFQRAAFGRPDGGPRRWPWGDTPPTERHGNFGYRHWAPTPVGTHPEGASAWGVQDLVGDGWEWTNTVFAGLPGFTTYIPGYAGYSADFFDGKHYVLKGGSWATADDLVRPSFRNWFQAHYPYVFSTFRCVVDG